jgi:hypothetical protein
MTERTYPPFDGVHLSTERPTILGLDGGVEPGWFAWMRDYHSTLWCNDSQDARKRRDDALAEAALWQRVAKAIDHAQESEPT